MIYNPPTPQKQEESARIQHMHMHKVEAKMYL